VFNYHIGTSFGKQIQMKFNTTQVMRGDFTARATAHVQLVQAGIEKPSEARPEFDLGDAGDLANQLYANSALQPLGAAPEQIRPQGQLTTDPNTGEQLALPPGQVQTTPAGGGSGVPSVSGRKYMRDLAGRVGRGQPLEQALLAVLTANPHDEAHIVDAYHQLVERTA